MADKPRLKGRDEIMGSIGERGRRKHEPEPPVVELDTDATELDEAILPSAQELAEKLLAREDKRPLDFGRYTLPNRGAAAKPPPEPKAPARERSAPAAPRAEINLQPLPAAQPDPQPQAKTAFEPQAEPDPVVMEYTFQSFEDEPAPEPSKPRTRRIIGGNPPQPEAPKQTVPQQQDVPARNTARDRLRRRVGRLNPDAPQQGEEVPPTPAEFELEASETQDVTAPQVQAGPPQAPGDVEQSERSAFLERISGQFERQFSEKFDEGIRRTAKPSKPVRPDPEPRRQPQLKPQPAPPPDEEFIAMVQRQERERTDVRIQPHAPPEPRRAQAEAEPAQDFLERFQQDVREEEQERAEDFKETLAQKFMRERERYLKELGLPQEPVPDDGPPEQPVPQQPQQRRKLDFQIQPEMHMREGDLPVPKAVATPPPPVTYNQSAVVKPQTPVPDNFDVPAHLENGGKKTPEQLLMELGRQNQGRAQPAARLRPQAAPLKFTFETPDEQAEKKKRESKEKQKLLPQEKWPRRIVLISMAIALLAIVLLVTPFALQYAMPDTAQEPEPLSSLPAVTEDTLSVYESRSFAQTAQARNVIFKNADATLKNVNVSEYVIIEGIDAAGKIRLEDVAVGTAISLKTAGINALELYNVKAERVIINNTSANVTVTTSGDSDIGVVEVRTPTVVRQTELASDAPGIRGVAVTAAEAGGDVEAKLDSLSLRTLTTEANVAVVAFENGTTAEAMTSDGSLTLSGTGKVLNLSIGRTVGQGAGDFSDHKDVSLVVKGVTVTNLNVLTTANLNLATAVSTVVTSDNILIGGDGSVGTFTLNPRTGAGRLIVEIAGLSVQDVYANTQSRISITGSARVGTLNAAASTYALGNKVNHLIVGADDVIYENEPDHIKTADGVKPPQSRTENPNLDLEAEGVDQPAVDTTGEDFATTCGHSRESGGFVLGNGSADDPYQVADAAQLAHVGTHLISHFLQTSDIDVAKESRFAGGAFPMIASGGEAFSGTYDGGGYAISNLSISSGAENVGLFAENKGTIRNVRLTSGTVESTAKSRAFVGGIVGLNYEGGSVRSCSNGASVTGGDMTYTGGIAGYNFRAKVHDCYNYAKISGMDIVGGLVGMNRQSATLTGSYNAGVVTGESDTGAVAGKNEDATIANCYFLEGSADLGIGAGTGTAIEKTSGEMQDPQMAADLAAGAEDSLWTSGDSGTAGYRYPTLRKP